MSMALQIFLLAFLAFWASETYPIINQVYKEYEKPFNPYTILHIEEDGRFKTKAIKDAYKKLSAKYNPQNVDLKKIDKSKAVARYENLKLAYKTLSDKVAFENYKTHGDPKGSKCIRAFAFLWSIITVFSGENMVMAQVMIGLILVVCLILGIKYS